MARIELEGEEFEAVEDLAERVDAYRLAVKLVRHAGLITDAEPEDVLDVARFLVGEASF